MILRSVSEVHISILAFLILAIYTPPTSSLEQTQMIQYNSGFLRLLFTWFCPRRQLKMYSHCRYNPSLFLPSPSLTVYFSLSIIMSPGLFMASSIVQCLGKMMVLKLSQVPCTIIFVGPDTICTKIIDFYV